MLQPELYEGGNFLSERFCQAAVPRQSPSHQPRQLGALDGPIPGHPALPRDGHGQGRGTGRAVGDLRARRDSVLIPGIIPCFLSETCFPQERKRTFLAAFVGWLSSGLWIPGKMLDDFTRNALHSARRAG